MLHQKCAVRPLRCSIDRLCERLRFQIVHFPRGFLHVCRPVVRRPAHRAPSRGPAVLPCRNAALASAPVGARARAAAGRSGCGNGGRRRLAQQSCWRLRSCPPPRTLRASLFRRAAVVLRQCYSNRQLPCVGIFLAADLNMRRRKSRRQERIGGRRARLIGLLGGPRCRRIGAH